MRMNLKVPFAEKDEAKKLGARWDAARKTWYVEGDADLAPLARWSPSPHEGAGSREAVQKAPPAKSLQAAGVVIVGSRYVERPRLCECLPWEACSKCQTTGFSA